MIKRLFALPVINEYTVADYIPVIVFVILSVTAILYMKVGG